VTISEDEVVRQQTRVYRRLVANAQRDLRRLVGDLSQATPEGARNALLEVMPLLTERYGDAAGVASLGWYDDLRDTAGVRGAYVPQLAQADLDAVQRATRRAAGSLWTGRPIDTLVSLDSILDLHVKRVGRDTMTSTAIADPRAHGWRRVAVGATCGFCNMLASRGAVYKERTADFAAHHECNCAASPSFDPYAPQVSTRQYQVSRRTAAMSPEQRAVHNERARAWIDDFERTGAL
jgi:hypothetical protein